MFNLSGSEFPVEHFGTEIFQIGDHIRPQVQNIVPRKSE